jgi:hypothetical protein
MGYRELNNKDQFLPKVKPHFLLKKDVPNWGILTIIVTVSIITFLIKKHLGV